MQQASYFVARVTSGSERLGMVSAAVDGLVAGRVEVDEVDEQLATFDADKAAPVPTDFVAVSGAYRQLTVVDTLTALTHIHTDIQ